MRPRKRYLRGALASHRLRPIGQLPPFHITKEALSNRHAAHSLRTDALANPGSPLNRRIIPLVASPGPVNSPPFTFVHNLFLCTQVIICDSSARSQLPLQILSKYIFATTAAPLSDFGATLAPPSPSRNGSAGASRKRTAVAFLTRSQSSFFRHSGTTTNHSRLHFSADLC
ncbi:hypothetical protein VTK56DRAFT_10232 [Thermocarpiscus australiensis]